jgi:hypothetical protein
MLESAQAVNTAKTVVEKISHAPQEIKNFPPVEKSKDELVKNTNTPEKAKSTWLGTIKKVAVAGAGIVAVGAVAHSVKPELVQPILEGVQTAGQNLVPHLQTIGQSVGFLKKPPTGCEAFLTELDPTLAPKDVAALCKQSSELVNNGFQAAQQVLGEASKNISTFFR